MRLLSVLVIAVLVVIPMAALATTVLPITTGTAGLYGFGGPTGLNGTVDVSGPGFFYEGIGGPGFSQEINPFFTQTSIAFTQSIFPPYDNGSIVTLKGVTYTKGNNIPPSVPSWHARGLYDTWDRSQYAHAR